MTMTLRNNNNGNEAPTIQSDGASHPKWCRRQSTRAGSSSLPTSWRSLLKLAVVGAVANSKGMPSPSAASASASATAFVQVGLASQRRIRRSLHSENRRHRTLGRSNAEMAAVVARTRTPSRRLRPSHHYSWRSDGGDVWSEVFQNAIGAFDKRLDNDENAVKMRHNVVGDDANGYGPHIQFVSPLLEDGYPPAVLEYERSQSDAAEKQWQRTKPMLLYLPGFDGTILSPFLQFPSLGEEFDVRAMKVDMADRSTFEELKEAVLDYLLAECRGGDAGGEPPGATPVYLVGESFGGILATEVSLELNRATYGDRVNLRGLVLVNPATSYLRSRLYELGPPVAEESRGGALGYVFSLATRLLPLFLDEGCFFGQLTTILSSKGLPAVVNDPRREAYMGRVAFDLLNRLKFMPKETLRWRLEEWLEWGCGIFEDRLETLRSARKVVRDASGDGGDEFAYALLKMSQELRVLIVAGELDLTLPSVEEAERLSSEAFRKARVHVVPGAGHASTCGGSLNLVRLLRETFPEVSEHGGTTSMGTEDRGEEEGEWLNGLEPRYDGASIGLNPLSLLSCVGEMSSVELAVDRVISLF